MEISDAIAILTADQSATGIFTDFDGTLSPIVPIPEDAEPVDGSLDALAALARRFGLVSIVSARSLEDLKKRAAAPGVLLCGAYGRERSDRPVRRATEGWETVSLAAIAATSALDGVSVERKGTGVALHFRAAPQHADAVRKIADLLVAEYGLELRPGRMVCDLLVPGPGKGDAIASLIAERSLRCALVAGDDVADVEAFRMLKGGDVQTVVVAVSSAEAPEGLGEHADLLVDGPAELTSFLRLLEAAP
jgi:trehalose 6-phosphate phosphatase